MSTTKTFCDTRAKRHSEKRAAENFFDLHARPAAAGVISLQMKEWKGKEEGEGKFAEGITGSKHLYNAQVIFVVLYYCALFKKKSLILELRIQLGVLVLLICTQQNTIQMRFMSQLELENEEEALISTNRKMRRNTTANFRIGAIEQLYKRASKYCRGSLWVGGIRVSQWRDFEAMFLFTMEGNYIQWFFD